MFGPPSKFLNQETADRVRQMDAEGLQRREIAKILGCTPTTVHKIGRRFGLPSAKKNSYKHLKVRREAVRAEIIRLSVVMTQSEVAKALKCSNSTVTSVLREANPFHYGGRGRKPKGTLIPKWVPPDWGEEYVEIARVRGEEAAAAWARAAKRDTTRSR